MSLLSDREGQLLEAVVTLEKRRVELAMEHNALYERDLALRQATLGRSDADLAVAAVLDGVGLDTDAFERTHGLDPTAVVRALVELTGGPGFVLGAHERGVDVERVLADGVADSEDETAAGRAAVRYLAERVVDRA